VFEPNRDELWAEIRRLVHDLLTRFYEAGAFAGSATREAFFVRCDRTTMTRNDLDNGRLVCLVGVAPAEPLEYIVIEFAVASDGRVSAEVVM
jgi:phage tail sheath protein FI